MTNEELKNNNEIELLWNVSQSLASSRVLNEVLQLIVTATAEVMHTKICSIMLLDKDNRVLKLAATQALSTNYHNKGPVRVGESVSGRVVKKGKPIVVENVADDPGYAFPDMAKKEKLASMACVPMFYKDTVIGVINCYSKKPRVFTTAEIKTLQSVANQSAIAIENTRLEKEVSQARKALVERKLVDQAKAILIESERMTEKEAYQSIQKTSRDNRVSMGDVAQSIILVHKMKK